MASEMGVLPIPKKDIVRKWRLQPGKMLLVDLDEGPHHLRRGDQGDAGQEPSLSRSGWKRTQLVLEDLPAAAARGAERPTWRCSIASRPSATPRRTCAS